MISVNKSLKAISSPSCSFSMTWMHCLNFVSVCAISIVRVSRLVTFLFFLLLFFFFYLLLLFFLISSPSSTSSSPPHRFLLVAVLHLLFSLSPPSPLLLLLLFSSSSSSTTFYSSSSCFSSSSSSTSPLLFRFFCFLNSQREPVNRQEEERSWLTATYTLKASVNWLSWMARLLLLLVGCLTSQLQASVSQGRICSDSSTCCHTEIEVADPTFYLTQSQYTDTGPTSPSADPITPGAWQGGHRSANFEVTGMTRPRKNPGASGIRTRDLPLSRRTP